MMFGSKTRWLICLAAVFVGFALVVNAASAAEYVYPRSSKYKGVTINVIMVAEGMCKELFPLLPDFEAKTGIKVNLELYPYQSLQEKMMISLTQRSGAYDIVHIDCVRYGQFAGQGWVIPLDDYIAKTDPEILKIEDHLPGVMVEQAYWDGKVYGLPYISSAMGLLYRKDLLDKYGVEVPATWEQLIEENEKLQGKLPSGMYPNILTARRDESMICTYFNPLGSYGGYVYDDKFHSTMKSEANQKAVETLKTLLQYCAPGAVTYDHAEVLQSFGQGNAVFGTYWLNMAPIFEDPRKSTIVGKWEVVLMPGVRQSDGSIKRANTSGGWGLGINKYSEHKGAAWEFITWATSEEVLRITMKGGFPSRASILRDPEVQKEHREFPVYLEALSYTIGRPRIMEWPEISNSMQVWISNALTGETSIAAALERMDDEINSILKEGGKQK